MRIVSWRMEQVALHLKETKSVKKKKKRAPRVLQSCHGPLLRELTAWNPVRQPKKSSKRMALLLFQVSLSGFDFHCWSRNMMSVWLLLAEAQCTSSNLSNFWHNSLGFLWSKSLLTGKSLMRGVWKTSREWFFPNVKAINFIFIWENLGRVSNRNSQMRAPESLLFFKNREFLESCYERPDKNKSLRRSRACCKILSQPQGYLADGRKMQSSIRWWMRAFLLRQVTNFSIGLFIRIISSSLQTTQL